MSSVVEKISVPATIKNVKSTADKGGTVIVQMEIANGEESSEILRHANKTCTMIVDFSDGQQDLDFEEDNGSKE